MDCQLLSFGEYNRYWYRVEISWDFCAAMAKYLNQIRISRGFSQVGSPGLHIVSFRRLLLCLTREVRAGIVHKAMLY